MSKIFRTTLLCSGSRWLRDSIRTPTSLVSYMCDPSQINLILDIYYYYCIVHTNIGVVEVEVYELVTRDSFNQSLILRGAIGRATDN